MSEDRFYLFGREHAMSDESLGPPGDVHYAFENVSKALDKLEKKKGQRKKTMDPDKLLERILLLAGEILRPRLDHFPSMDNYDRSVFNSSELARAVQDLNEWIARGGFLPRDWQQQTPREEVEEQLHLDGTIEDPDTDGGLLG